MLFILAFLMKWKYTYLTRIDNGCVKDMVIKILNIILYVFMNL